MKCNQSVWRWCPGILLLALICGFGCQTKPNAGVGSCARVVRLKGSARFSNDGTNWKVVKSGTTFQPGCVVQMAVDSSADVVFGSGLHPRSYRTHNLFDSHDPTVTTESAVRLYADTILAIDKTSSPTNLLLNLRAGRMLANFNAGPGGICAIGLQNETVHFVYACCDVSYEGAVRVKAGSVMVTNGVYGTGMVVPAGRQYDPGQNQVENLAGALPAD